MRPNRPNAPRAAIAAALVLVLAGCGAPTAPADTSAAFTIRGTVFEETNWTPVGVALYLFDETTGSVSAVSAPSVPSGFAERSDVDPAFTLIDGFGHLSPFAAVAADGTFALALPVGDAVPESVLFPAAAFWRTIASEPTCTVRASDDAARVSGVYVVGPFITLPSLFTTYVRDGDVIGGLAVTFDEAADFDLPIDEDDLTYATWAYADRPVAVATDGCTVEGVDVELDVNLDAGWNQLAYQYQVGGATPSARLVSAEASEVFTVLD